MLKTLATTAVLALSLSACAAHRVDSVEPNPQLVQRSTTITTDKVLVDGNGYYQSAPDREVVIQKEAYAPNGDRIIVQDRYIGTDQVIFNDSYPYYGRLKYSQGR